MAKHLEFGRLLRHARLEKALRQHDVAQELDIATEYYARFERGNALGAVDTFAALRVFLGFDANPVLAALGLRSKPVPRRRRAPIRRAAPVLGSYSGFGQLLKQARMQRDLTQSGVATAIGCSPHYYTLIEIGQKLPSMKTFAKLQHCLGFDANELLDALIRVPRPFSAFGQLLGRARSGQGTMLTEVASAVGCAAEHYERIEAGAELPTIMLFVGLHRVLGFDADGVLRELPMEPELDPGEIWGPHYEFGRLLKQARLERRMLHADVARVAERAPRYCARLEAGIQLPSLKNFATLHRCLGFDANRLLSAISNDPRPFTHFGRQLASARTSRTMAEAEAATIAGCAHDRYQRIEDGAELPTLMELVRLHRCLEFHADSALRLIPVEPELTTFDRGDTSQLLDRSSATKGHA
jgi:transcriptional regulator with XRE-family HTH domain